MNMFSKIVTHLLQNPPKEKMPKKVFHGGCNGCRIQDKVGTLLCSRCQHHDADWNKPNLNGADRRKWWWKQKIKFFSKFVTKPEPELGIFHGGCLGCKSQEKHGVNRCTGCQYFDANWSKPNLYIKY